jgi:hypothetical protein
VTTRLTIIEKVVVRLGGKVGDIDSGGATTAVLGGLVNAGVDDEEHKNCQLWMMSAATEADRQRVITTWGATAGQATFATRADTTYTNERYALLPPMGITLADVRDAINEILNRTRRVRMDVTKTVTSQERYGLSGLTHVLKRKDILGTFQRNHTPGAAADSWESFDETENIRRKRLGSHGIISDAGAVFIELWTAMTADQEIGVVTMDNFAVLTADTDTVVMPDDVLIPGTVYELTRIHREGQDRTRLDRLMLMSSREYAHAASALMDLPPTDPDQSRIDLRGA